jgi:hypothetical protein
LVPVRYAETVTDPDTLRRAKWWPKFFEEGKHELECGRVVVASHEFPPTDDIPGETRFYVKIYDETFQPAHWYFRLTKDNLERVSELSGEPIPASLLLLSL